MHTYMATYVCIALYMITLLKGSLSMFWLTSQNLSKYLVSLFCSQLAKLKTAKVYPMI